MSRSLTKTLAVIGLVLSLAILGSSVPVQAGSSYLWASGPGDGTVHYNTKYGVDPYVTDGLTLWANLQMNSPYGNDHWNIYLEIPIASLRGHGQILTRATLQLDSLGAGTGYWYGSAYVRHMDPGTSLPTGNIVDDNPLAWGYDTSWTFYNSDGGPDGSVGIKSFDVTAAAQADLTAGRNYSVFLLEASRDTGVTIYASETAEQGPRIYANTMVPIPGSMFLLMNSD
jgi:hypothetical protein